ncbi:Ppx/GppA family phosphatase [Sphingomonas mesophila]|uniref:Ppx/GppA family phosphatase n=1 Tax=Sphingomonas mesophila TaxID=2303576 RepID=UPI000E584FFA|nr:Ppx/GppA family phosphatase [Sphingomonas mesophila]
MSVDVLPPTGIVDIGSNSVRFVVFGGNARVPSTLFNEKISPALGRGVQRDGRLEQAAMARSLAALTRFARLARDMNLERLHVVATAAVRDADNGGEFLAAVRDAGLDAVVLSGPEEAELAALGVLSAIPDANGVVADLGGGSLELVRVADGAPGERISLPLGVLRVGGMSRGALAEQIALAVVGLGFPTGQSLYLVGGSFRALARLDLADLNHPLPIIHQHAIDPERSAVLGELLTTTPGEALRKITRLSAGRIEILPAALAVFQALIDVLAPRAAVTSAFGLREGLLFRDLVPAMRAEDPLLAAALEIGEMLGRFGDHGDLIDRWIAPLFGDDDAAAARIRRTACLMSDVAWNAHPDYRAERAVEMALHGNFVGIDAHGRALLGQALCHVFGSDFRLPDAVAGLLTPAECERASAWGRAIRLAQRLSGGAEKGLKRSTLELRPGELVLTVKGSTDVVGESALKRLNQLAAALGRAARVEAG